MQFLELDLTKEIFYITLQLRKEGCHRIIQYFETNIEKRDDLDIGYEELSSASISA